MKKRMNLKPFFSSLPLLYPIIAGLSLDFVFPTANEKAVR